MRVFRVLVCARYVERSSRGPRKRVKDALLMPKLAKSGSDQERVRGFGKTGRGASESLTSGNSCVTLLSHPQESPRRVPGQMSSSRACESQYQRGSSPNASLSCDARPAALAPTGAQGRDHKCMVSFWRLPDMRDNGRYRARAQLPPGPRDDAISPGWFPGVHD